MENTDEDSLLIISALSQLTLAKESGKLSIEY